MLTVSAFGAGVFITNTEIYQQDKFFCFTTDDRSGWNWEVRTDEPIFCEPYGFEDEERYYSANTNVNHRTNEMYRDIYRKDSGTMLLLLIEKTPDIEVK